MWRCAYGADQAETVIGHIFRGPAGRLGGIPPWVGPVWVSAICSRRRVSCALILNPKNKLCARDATNRDTRGMLARIRMKLMPLLEKAIPARSGEPLSRPL